MNKARRKRIEEACELIRRAQEIITEVREEEDEAYNNLPEYFQYGEKGEAMEEAIDTLSDAEDYLDETESNLMYLAEN